MPRKSKTELPHIDLGNEKIGQRIARIRRAKGLTQRDLANKIGISQSIVSDYEIGRLRLYDEMVARFALALETTTDDIIGFNQKNESKRSLSLRYIKRIKEIELLPEHKIKAILKTLDDSIKANKEQ